MDSIAEVSDISQLPFFAVTFPLDDDSACVEKARDLVIRLKTGWPKTALNFEFFTNGITNKVLRCTNKDLGESVVVRVFGLNTDLLIDRSIELRNWLILSKYDCASPLLARFNNGLVCGYQPGKPVTVESVRDPAIAKEIARSLAAMHKIPLRPADKSIPQIRPIRVMLFDKAREYIENMPGKFENASKQAKFSTGFWPEQRLLEELEFLEQILTPLDSPVVFCHNDLLVHNILYDQDSGKVHFIDYEYAASNFQAFDIGDHFCEYAGVDNFDFTLYPSREYQLNWLRTYLEFYLNEQPSDAQVERLYVQVNKCAAAAHFIWSLWGVIQAKNSLIDFDFLGYAIARLEEYQKMKEQYFDLKLPN